SRILECVASGRGKKLSELDLLSREEKEQIDGWNRTGRERVRKSVSELFEEQVDRSPEAVAVRSGGERVTYRELNGRANRLGRHLKGMGVGAEVVVGLCVERSVEMVVGVMGIMKAGGAYLPLDPRNPLERLGYMLREASVTVLVTQRGMEERLPVHEGIVVYLG